MTSRTVLKSAECSSLHCIATYIMSQVDHHITDELYSTIYFGKDSLMTMNEELVYSHNACLPSATYADRRTHKARKVIPTDILLWYPTADDGLLSQTVTRDETCGSDFELKLKLQYMTLHRNNFKGSKNFMCAQSAGILWLQFAGS
jgi:hypothetical protein